MKTLIALAVSMCVAACATGPRILSGAHEITLHPVPAAAYPGDDVAVTVRVKNLDQKSLLLPSERQWSLVHGNANWFISNCEGSTSERRTLRGGEAVEYTRMFSIPRDASPGDMEVYVNGMPKAKTVIRVLQKAGATNEERRSPSRPNKSLQPTATAVMPPAAQEITPAVAVAEH
jgi:uncharacterized protein affecting Mg2+/Co2+ transport